jgi:RNA polymerase sigma factor (TIGR02999 family)
MLAAWRAGDPKALDRLLPVVYNDLRRLASRYMQGERCDHTFGATALVHEAYLRLAGRTHPRWHDRAHFFAVVAQLMRRILVDHARGHGAAKRGHGLAKLPLDGCVVPADTRGADLLALDDALIDLATLDPRKAQIVELRFFGGLTIEETAEMLELSTATVVNETRLARAWLFDEIRPR